MIPLLLAALLSATGQKVGTAVEADVSARTVKATGSTTARALKDRAADVVNVKDFGAAGDGTTDDTAAIQAALTAAGSGAGTVVFPQPTAYYRVTAPIKIPHNVVLRGSMRTKFIGSYIADRPRIQKTTTTTVGIPRFENAAIVNRDVIFYVDPTWSSPGSGGAPDGYYPQDVTIEGLSLRGSDGASTVAVYLEQGGELTIRDCDISGVRNAFLGRDVWRSSFERIKANARFEVEAGGTSLKFETVAACGNASGFDGFHLTNVSYTAFIGTTCDGGHESAYTLTACHGVTFVSPGAEQTGAPSDNEGAIFNFKGGNVATVTGAFSVADADGATTTITSAANGDIITFIGGYFAQSGALADADLYVTSTARVTYVNSQFKDASNNGPTVVFGTPGNNPSVVAVHYDGNWKRYLDGSVVQQNPMPGGSVFTGAAGTDAFALTAGARINLGSANIRQGTGTPEGAITAGVGSLFARTDGASGSTLYVKQAGAGNTGWDAAGTSSTAVSSFNGNCVASAVANMVPVQYLSDGWVRLAGRVKSSSGAIAPSTTLFTLDAAYRPNRTVRAITSDNLNTTGNVQIGSDGTVTVLNGITLTAGSNELPVDAIQFRKTN